MIIWLINPYGPIPEEGWRDYRFTILGRELASRGHEVIWWTANFSHHFKKFRSNNWEDRMVCPGFKIRLVPTVRYYRNIGIGRVAFELLFACRTYSRAEHEPRPHCIIGVDPPQPIGFLSKRLAERLESALILDVFDLWPELFVLGLPQKVRWAAPIVFQPFYQLRRTNLRSADAIVSLCETYLQMALTQAPHLLQSRSLVAFNGIDVAEFRSALQLGSPPSQGGISIRKSKNEIWAIHAGSLGPNYDILSLLGAAEILALEQSNIVIVIAGDGPLRPKIEAFVAEKRNSNLRFLGKLTHQNLIAIYRQCDIGICPYGIHSNVAMPDKVYDYLAAGLPMVNSLRGELKKVLERYGLGRQYVAGSPASLVAALKWYVEVQGRLKDTAERAARLASEFDQKRQYDKYADFVVTLLGTRDYSCAT